MAWFGRNADAVTVVSPTLFHLGTNITVDELPFARGAVATPTSVVNALRTAGVRVYPILYNDESHYETLLPKLRRLFAAPEAFIKQAVQLLVDLDMDGWNLDFEGYPGVQPINQAIRRLFTAGVLLRLASSQQNLLTPHVLFLLQLGPRRMLRQRMVWPWWHLSTNWLTHCML